MLGMAGTASLRSMREQAALHPNLPVIREGVPARRLALPLRVHPSGGGRVPTALTTLSLSLYVSVCEF